MAPCAKRRCGSGSGSWRRSSGTTWPGCRPSWPTGSCSPSSRSGSSSPRSPAFAAQWVGIADPTQKIVSGLSDNLPPDIANAIAPQIQAVIGTTRPGLLTFGAIAALWAATGGTSALMKAMNKAYEVEEDRSFVPKTALAIGLTLLATIGLLVAFVTIVGASILTTGVSQRLGLDQAAVGAISLLRWPLVFVLVSVAVAVLYKLAPNARIPFRWCLAGGVLFAIGWLIATGVFGLYVANFADLREHVRRPRRRDRPDAVVLHLGLHPRRGRGADRRGPQGDPTRRRRAAPDAVGGDRAGQRHDPRRRRGRPPRRWRSAGWRLDPPRRRRAREPARRRRVDQPPPSTPGDWALAAGVATVGASLGVLAAWLVGDRNRAT